MRKQAIQIVKPENRKFQLNLSELHRISNIDDMKDRYVVVLSIAGAYRKGKSFLLNFFIKFLTAQYKTRSISNWIDGNDESDVVRGFKWRSGRKQETIGIWMWSEVFTHDFDNGEKIAIILLDTQGIFDHVSSRADSTKIFAFSMLLSSVQCYNVMQNIQEDDLENLELFTEYARVAANSNEKPFQELIFIVRDWPYGKDIPYGFSEELKMELLLNENDQHSSEMKNLRKRITSSINKISIFLMPYPGRTVAEGSNFGLHNIDEKFIDSVKELAPRLFSPENLVVKKINGQNVRLKDLGLYLETYVELFNGKTLPEPKSMFMATAEITNSLLCEECITFYRASMKTFLDNADTFYEDQELMKTHENVKDETTKQFLEKSKFGGDELSAQFLQKLTFGMDENYFSFRRENDIKRNDFVIKENTAKINEMAEKYEEKLKELERAKDTMEAELYEQKRRALEMESTMNDKQHNDCLRRELGATFQTNVYMQLGNKFHTDFEKIFWSAKENALQQFDSRKKGASAEGRNDLEKDIDGHRNALCRHNESNKNTENKPRWGCNIL